MAIYVSGQRATADAFNNSGQVLLLGGQYRTTTATTSGATELQVLTTPSLTLAASSTYRLLLVLRITTFTVATDEFTIRIRDTSTSGTELGGNYCQSTANGHNGVTVLGFFTTTTAVTKTFIGSIARTNGTGTCIVNQPGSGLTCELIGASGIMTTA